MNKYGEPTPPQNYTRGGDVTLRDYFAAKAMQGLLASTTTKGGDIVAADAYKMADAMLAEREKA